MKSSNEFILDTACNWLSQENEILLVTVAKTWGSSPKPIGSMMLIKADGKYEGSVSGGCIEEDLIAKYTTGNLPDKQVCMLSYGISQHDAEMFGLPCGGQLELVLERVRSPDSFKIIQHAFQNNSPITRHLNIDTYEVTHSLASWDQKTSFDGKNLHKVFGPQWQIILIGANDLSKYVAQLSLLLNYQVIICDPREHASTDWIDTKITFTTQMPDDAVSQLTPVEQSIVLALTHDPKMDDMALMQALTMNLFYVGAIGSNRTQTARKKRLEMLDLNKDQISKLHGPVGLKIGSKTPAEIAISILAEITALRHDQKTNLSLLDTQLSNL